MSKPKIACCKVRSAHGAARTHWFHADDCVLLPGTEVDPKTTHPAGTNLEELSWRHHPVGCLCKQCVYVELHMDDDDDMRVPEGQGA